MILSGPEIIRIINRTRSDRRDGIPMMLPAIDIEPFDEKAVGPNSVDVKLSDKLLTYDTQIPSKNHPGEVRGYLDSREPNTTQEWPIPVEGLILRSGILYLGSTIERTMCAGIVPCIETRSSLARLGFSAHLSAGFGDDGFSGHWTLEITVVHPLKIYPGMRVAQISFTTITGNRKPYSGRYVDQQGPTASRLHEDKQ